MNELVLLIIVITLLVLPSLLIKGSKKPLLSYIKMGSVFILLLLVWGLGNEGKWPVKIILSAIAITALFKEYMSLKKTPS